MRVLADVHRQLAAAGAEGEEALVAVEGGQVAVHQFGVVAHANRVTAHLGNVRLDATDAGQLVAQVAQPARLLAVQELVKVRVGGQC